jgi:hypothetical protein
MESSVRIKSISKSSMALFIGMVAAPILFSTASAGTQATYYVSPAGSDSSPGNLSQPFLTITKARDVVRTINGAMTGDIYVYLRGGVYNVTTPILFGTSDNGTNGHNVIYKAYNSEIPVLCGGTKVAVWTVYSGKIYQAPLSRNTKLRSLYVNGVKASMASKTVTAQGSWGTFTVAGTEPWAENAGSTLDGIQFNTTDVGAYANDSDVELVQSHVWTQCITPVRQIATSGNYRVLKLQQPAGAIASTMAWGCALVATGACTIQNAFELLTTPGQFYFDRTNQKVYYYSNGENMSTATVIAPVSAGLIQISGSSTSDRVRNIQFYGITFEYDDWQLKDVAGSKFFAGVQGSALYTKYRADGNWHEDSYGLCDLPQATVTCKNCDSLRFERNVFVNLQSGICIALPNDVVNTTVIGNIFENTSGNSVVVGHPQHVYIGDGPLYPNGVEGISKNIVVQDNLVRNVATEFVQLEGMSAYFVDSCTFTHNDIANTPWNGLSVGWGWSNMPNSTTCRKNTITYNKVGNSQQVLPGDGGTMYTLGQQPGSVFAYNFGFGSGGNAHIMLDEGTKFYRVHDNVSQSPPNNWLFIFFATSQNDTMDNNYVNKNGYVDQGTNCPITNTHYEASAPPWSAAAQSIINNAGLEPAYQDLLNVKPDRTVVGTQSGISHDLLRIVKSSSSLINIVVKTNGVHRIKISGLDGRTIAAFNGQGGKTYSWRSPAPGLYLVRLQSEQGSQSIKMFINR